MAPIHDQIINSFRTISSPLKVNACLVRYDRCLSNFYIPISQGLFLHDSFEYMRQTFDDAIRDIFGRWDETELLDDKWFNTAFHASNHFSVHMPPRYWKEAFQAAATLTNNTDHKILLDIFDNTSGGETNVMVINERELYVEDHTLESSKRFVRRLFPSGDVIKPVSGVMPSDGVLTIIVAPRKMSHLQREENVSPANVKTDEERECQRECTECPGVVDETVRMTREASPSLSIQSAESCDSLVGRLWTFSSPDDESCISAA